MYTCIYCDVEIVKRSSEHIIHAALGSSFKSDNIICGDCNNYFSTKESGDIDEKFIKQFDLIRNFLNIKTDSGKSPPTIRRLKLGDEQVVLEPGGKLAYYKVTREEIRNEDGSVQIAITSPSIKKGKEQLEHIKRQYREKNEFTIEQSVLKKEYAKTPIGLSFKLGGEENTKAVAKMVYNFLYYLERESLIDLPDLDFYDLKQYLRHNSASSKVETGYDFINELPLLISEDDLSNYIFLTASSKQRIIFGQVVIFGKFRFSTIIYDNYEGYDFIFGVKQPLNSRKKEWIPSLEIQTFNSEVLINKAPYSKSNREQIGKALNKVMKIYQEKVSEEVQSRIINEVMEEMLKDDEGLKRTEEIQKEILIKVAQKYSIFINKVDTETPIDLQGLKDK